jgi:hypothetical protein
MLGQDGFLLAHGARPRGDLGNAAESLPQVVDEVGNGAAVLFGEHGHPPMAAGVFGIAPSFSDRGRLLEVVDPLLDALPALG